MYNKSILMGRITHDLTIKTTPSGVSVLSFGLAVERSYQAKGEERKTDFFNIVAWRSTAEFIARFFAKGKMILVEGELQTRQYTDKNGNNVTVTELVVDSASFTGEKAQNTNGNGADLNANATGNIGYTPTQQNANQGYSEPNSNDTEEYPF